MQSNKKMTNRKVHHSIQRQLERIRIIKKINTLTKKISDYLKQPLIHSLISSHFIQAGIYAKINSTNKKTGNNSRRS